MHTLWLKAQVCALFTPSSSPCLMRTLSDLFFDLSIHFISYLFTTLIFLLFLLPYTFYFLDVVDYNHPRFRWGAGSTRTIWTPPQVMSPTTTSSRRLMSSTPTWPSNGSLKTSTTMTWPSVRRSLMRAEDEPITLKKTACRPVCRRRQWVMTLLFGRHSNAKFDGSVFAETSTGKPVARTDEHVLRNKELMHNYFCKSAQSLRSSRGNVWRTRNLHDWTGQPVVGGQLSSSFVPSVIKTEVPLDCADRAHKDLLLQKYGERIEKQSQQDRLSKFCMDARFLNVVEIGQYFMRKDTAEFSQVTDAVACREYTLPRDEGTSEPKGWIRGNTKNGPALEVATCCLHGKYGVEIRIMSMNRQFSLLGQNFSWLKQVSHEFEQQWAGNLRSAVRRTRVEIECEWFCMSVKGQSKTTKTHFCQLCRLFPENNTYHLRAEIGPMLNQDNIRSTMMKYRRNWCIFFVVENMYIEKMMEQLSSEELKDNLQKYFPHCPDWSDDKWKKSMAGGGGNKKRYQCCTDSSGTIL